MSTANATAVEVQPLFRLLKLNASCPRCMDTGFAFDAHGIMRMCPFIRSEVHAKPNNAACFLGRSIELLKFNKLPINHLLFDIARTLTFFASEKPCPREDLLRRNFSWTSSQLRKLHSAIEELRSVWRLPVGSRKESPAGYWIMTDEADFKAWVDRAKQSPITQLTTIHRVAKANWPVFAEQLELEFFSDMTEAPK